MWILLKEYLDNNKNFRKSSIDCPLDLKKLRSKTPSQERQIVRKLMPIAFKLYDDDDELYFSGYMSSACSEEDFEPLDWAMGNYGCTKLKYRNPKTGKWKYL